LCCVQVPHCCWRQHRAINYLLAPASNNLQKWFLSPTGRLNFGLILGENLLLCSSYLPLGVSQWVLWDISWSNTLLVIDCRYFNGITLFRSWENMMTWSQYVFIDIIMTQGPKPLSGISWYTYTNRKVDPKNLTYGPCSGFRGS
jgi:hypothetical protein